MQGALANTTMRKHNLSGVQRFQSGISGEEIVLGMSFEDQNVAMCCSIVVLLVFMSSKRRRWDEPPPALAPRTRSNWDVRIMIGVLLLDALELGHVGIVNSGILCFFSPSKGTRK